MKERKIMPRQSRQVSKMCIIVPYFTNNHIEWFSICPIFLLKIGNDTLGGES